MGAGRKVQEGGDIRIHVHLIVLQKHNIVKGLPSN